MLLSILLDNSSSAFHIIIYIINSIQHFIYSLLTHMGQNLCSNYTNVLSATNRRYNFFFYIFLKNFLSKFIFSFYFKLLQKKFRRIWKLLVVKTLGCGWHWFCHETTVMSCENMQQKQNYIFKKSYTVTSISFLVFVCAVTEIIVC